MVMCGSNAASIQKPPSGGWVRSDRVRWVHGLPVHVRHDPLRLHERQRSVRHGQQAGRPLVLVVRGGPEQRDGGALQAGEQRARSRLLPATEATASSAPFEGGTAKWWGTLDVNTAMWTINALGIHDNPTGVGVATVRRKLVAKVPVTPTNIQANNNPAWNYIYAKQTGTTCDVTVSNNLSGQSRFYVAGNLCINNNASITSDSLIVRGSLDLSNNAQVGVDRDARRDLRRRQLPLRQQRLLGGPVHGQSGQPADLLEADAERLGRGQRHRTLHRRAGRRFPLLVRVLDAGALTALHSIQWDAACLRHQLPEPGLERGHDQPDAGGLVHVPSRAGRVHDARRRNERHADDAVRRLSDRLSGRRRSGSGSTTS